MIYDSKFDENGDEHVDRMIIFVRHDGREITSMTQTDDTAISVSQSGIVFIVDKVVVNQINKFEIVNNGQLRLKDGEAIEEPKKTVEELQEEDLIRQLSELRAKKGKSADK